MIALHSLAGRRCSLLDFRKLGLEVYRTVIDLDGLGRDGYPRSLLLHFTDTVRMHMSEILVPNDVKGLTGPNDAKGLTGQVVELQSNILLQSSKMGAGVAG
jgi:hypothetical protein